MKVLLRDGTLLEEIDHWGCVFGRLFPALSLVIVPLFLLLGCLPQPGCTGTLNLWGKRNLLYAFWVQQFGPSDEMPGNILSVISFYRFCMRQAASTQDLTLDLASSNSVFLCFLLTPTFAYRSLDWFSSIKCVQEPCPGQWAGKRYVLPSLFCLHMQNECKIVRAKEK